MGLSVRHDVVGDVLHLTFMGEFDLGTLPIISDALSKALVGPCATIVVDLNDVSSPDDSALGLLLVTSTRAREEGRRLVVTCALGPTTDQMTRFGIPLLER